MIDTPAQAPTRLPSGSGLLAAVEPVIVATLPPLCALFLAVSWLPGSNEGVDFRQFYAAAVRLLHGGDPYVTAFTALGQHHPFVYPPLAAFVIAPFTILTPHTASVVFGLICIALTPVALWIMNVRDWRIWSVTLVWAPAFVAWQTGNQTALLLVLLALLWRYRDRPLAAGALTAVAISMKVFMWPLALWLLATRRWRATGWGLLTGVIVNAVCWAMVGFDNLKPFVHNSGLDVTAYWRAGYSIAATLAPLGITHSTGSLLTLLASVLLGLAVLYAAYVRHDERGALTLTVVLVLAASPIVWNHYLLLLLVPMAITCPRLNWIWGLPILMWLCPYAPGTNAWQRPLEWALVTLIVLVLRARGRELGTEHRSF